MCISPVLVRLTLCISPVKITKVLVGKSSPVVGDQSRDRTSGTLLPACLRLDRPPPSRIRGRWPQARRPARDRPYSGPGESIVGPRRVVLLCDADLRSSTSANRAASPWSRLFPIPYAPSFGRYPKVKSTSEFIRVNRILTPQAFCVRCYGLFAIILGASKTPLTQVPTTGGRFYVVQYGADCLREWRATEGGVVGA